MGVEPKIGAKLPPKWMVYLFHGKPYEQMDDLGGFPLFLETPMCFFSDGTHFIGPTTFLEDLEPKNKKNTHRHTDTV